MDNKHTILLLNDIFSILDLLKILTYYIDYKKVLEIRNKNRNKDNIFFKVLQSSVSKDFKK